MKIKKSINERSRCMDLSHFFKFSFVMFVISSRVKISQEGNITPSMQRIHNKIVADVKIRLPIIRR